MKALIACTFALICFTVLQVHAQTGSFGAADSLAGRFVNAIRNTDKEKIMLQTDRKIYAAGETIWFKAFLLSTINNRVDTSSKNLFVDLVDDNDKIVKQLVLNAARLKTDGAILLSDTLPTGYYWLRCYTQNILQTDSLSICVNPLYIKNLGNSSVLDFTSRARPKLASNTPQVQFFPEGGAVIAGINSTGALKVRDAAGNPVMVTGTITDMADSVVTTFATNRFGLARISFYPVWFKKYFAVTTVNGKQVKYPLTPWNPFAAQLAVTQQTGDFIKADITLEDSIYSRKFTTYILALSKDSICFAGIGRGMYQVDIPTAGFPGGIATLLLFDANQQLLSERKVFINKDNYKINVVTDKLNYAARDKAQLNIDVTDAAGKPVVAALNISVQDSRIMAVSDELKADTILPERDEALNDWLKSHKASLSPQDIDLLMLAQHPVFTNWQALANTKKPHIADATNLLLNLEGTVINRKKLPVKKQVVTAISINGTNPYIGIDTTTEGGGFALPLPIDRGNLILKVQLKNKHDITENDSIIVKNFTFPQFATPTELKHFLTTGKQVFQQRMARYQVDTVFVGTGKEWLAPVTVKSNARPKAVIDYDIKKRLSSTSYIISGNKLGNGAYGELATSMLMVPGLALVGGRLVLNGDPGRGMTGNSASVEPIIIMDGLRIDAASIDPGVMPNGSPVMNFLSSIDTRSIDFVEVLNGADGAMYGVGGGHGVIVINTKTKPREVSRDVEPFKIIQPLTYHTSPGFVMPDYAMKTVKTAKTPDPRTTIYWDGNLVTKPDGKATAGFYTADDATSYTVIVTGLTANGEYVYKRITLSRK